MTTPTPTPVLSLATRATAAGPVIEAAGQLDYDTAPRMRAAITAVLNSVPAPPTVDLDLAHLTFCDSSGLTALIHARNEAAQAGTQLRLGAVSANVTDLLALTGAQALFPSAA
ncbi:STAS domain-containing protein [Kitasatospora sp. NPDC057223]|uniref:STAS domain-containing protein n=1 Tax=Kitasatospora sp. NPDC057223 TaxID=3346055 RepID=UPI00364113D5